ncbi:MAG: 4Fe-4S ferredoxin, partial [Chloroflexi bacterium]
MKEQMKYLKLSKEEMANLLDELRREFRVVAPVRREGLILFEEIGSGKEAQLDFGNSRKSPKDFFFPQMEVLFSYQLSDNELKIEEPQHEPRKTVIFGMRPCDARALLLLDKVFLEGEVQDSNYRRRREENIILALGCTHPHRTCFCTSVGGNPFGTEGIDALFIDLGKTYVVEVLTQKGEELLRDRLSEADEESLK